MTDPEARPVTFAGIYPGDQGWAARIGRRLSGLPGRWRWSVETFLRWWLAELAGFRPPRLARPDTGLRVGADDNLEFTFALAPAALGLVSDRLALALAAQTPFAAAEVLAAYRLDPDGAAIRVTARALPVALLGAIPEGCDRIVLEGTGPDLTVPLPMALLGPALRDRRLAERRRRTAVAGAMLLALAIPLLVPIATRQRALAQAQASLDEARILLQPSVRRVARIGRDDAAVAEARRRRANGLHPLLLLAHLTDRLDDDTYLTEIAADGGVGRIAGVATSAGPLPRWLEADPLLAEVRFLAPVSRDPEGVRQRFEIGFTVAPR